MPEQPAREWITADTTRARIATVREWLALRADENRRHLARIPADDATARAKRESAYVWPKVGLRARDSILPDRASLTMPISGVHVLPVFGKGEHTAPYLGSDESVTSYADEASESAWRYVAANTMGDTFAARTMAAMRVKADKDGRPLDRSKRDDVMSEARQIFVNIVMALMTRDDVTHVYGYPSARVDTGERDTVGGVAEFLAPRMARCGVCEACTRSDGVSKWLVNACHAPVSTIDAVTPNRILTRALMRAVADPTQSTSSVYATRAKYFLRHLVADAAITEETNSDPYAGRDALRHTPRDAAALIRFMVAALESVGEEGNATVTKGLSPVARSILTRAMGTKDTDQGAETALKRARELWPAAHGTRREAQERAQDERKRARDERRNAGKRARRATAAASEESASV